MTIRNEYPLLRNCEFSFRCDKKWDDLDRIDTITNDDKKFCTDCKKEVHLIKNAHDLVIALKENHCVAIERILTIESTALRKSKHFLGALKLPHEGS